MATKSIKIQKKSRNKGECKKVISQESQKTLKKTSKVSWLLPKKTATPENQCATLKFDHKNPQTIVKVHWSVFRVMSPRTPLTCRKTLL